MNLTLAAARTLIYYFEPSNLREPAVHLHAIVAPRMAEPEATPYRKALWLHMWRLCAHFGKQPQLAAQALEQMLALARQHGLRDIEFLALLAELDRAMPRGDVATARAVIERAESLLDSTHLGELAVLELSKTRLATMRHEADSALHHASRARKLSIELQMPAAMLGSYAGNEAMAQLLGEDFEGARATLLGVIGTVHPGYADEIDAMLQGIDAYLAARDGLPDAHQRIATLWAGLRRRRSYDLFGNLPQLSARLCVLALERGIETDFVRSLISKCELAVPDDAPASWPWALRIQAFGGLSVWRNEDLLGSEGKAQRKPLALLQLLVAMNAFSEGDGVEIARLVELLWPDVEPGSPKSSFDMTLSRLRKWLGVEQALKLSNGRVSLNPRLVWCDVAAFELACDALQRTLQPHADADALSTQLRQLRRLYRGSLFGSAAPEPWLVQARERHALRFARLVRDAGRHLETLQHWGEALSLYESSLEQDLLAEPVHLALIRCLLALDRDAEARRALLRSRAVLGSTLSPASRKELGELAERLGM